MSDDKFIGLSSYTLQRDEPHRLNFNIISDKLNSYRMCVGVISFLHEYDSNNNNNNNNDNDDGGGGGDHENMNNNNNNNRYLTLQIQGIAPANPTFFSACSSNDTVQYRPSVLLFTLFYYYLQYFSIFVSGNALGIALPFIFYTELFLPFLIL